MSDTKVIFYYVTGHGYGHATRVIGFVNFLLKKDYIVHIVSSLDPNFFQENINDDNVGENLYCHKRSLDSGAIQIDPLHVDAITSMNNYYNNIHSKRTELINNEVEYLKAANASLILIDATPLASAAANKANIKSVIISNFTWDFTYQAVLDLLKNQNILSELQLIQFNEMVHQCNLDVNCANYYIRLPGVTPLPNNYNGEVIFGPLITRKAKKSRQESRLELGISEDLFVVVYSFGGHKRSDQWELHDDMLPPNWICLVLAAENEIFESDRFIPLSKSIYVPDIVNCADAVLGKLGYGSISESLSQGIPLIYVPRTDWPEEHYLEALIMKYNGGIKISEADFLKGNWESFLIEALKRKNSWDITDLNPNFAFEELETIINRIIND